MFSTSMPIRQLSIFKQCRPAPRDQLTVQVTLPRMRLSTPIEINAGTAETYGFEVGQQLELKLNI